MLGHLVRGIANLAPGQISRIHFTINADPSAASYVRRSVNAHGANVAI